MLAYFVGGPWGGQERDIKDIDGQLPRRLNAPYRRSAPIPFVADARLVRDEPIPIVVYELDPRTDTYYAR